MTTKEIPVTRAEIQKAILELCMATSAAYNQGLCPLVREERRETISAPKSPELDISAREPLRENPTQGIIE